MPVAKLKKAVLYYHNSIQDEVLLTLQSSGVCEIIPGNEENDKTSAAATKAKSSAAAKVSECDNKLSELRFLLRFLEPYYNDPVSGIARALGERPGNSLFELAEMASKCNITEESEMVRGYERKLSSIRIEMSHLDNMKTILGNLTGFPYDLNIFGSVGRLRAITGSLPTVQSEVWKDSLLKEVGDDCEIYLAPPGKKDRDVWAVLMYASERENEVMEIGSKNNFTISELDFRKDDMRRSVSEQIAQFLEKQNKLREEEKSIHEKVVKYANEHVDIFRKLVDHWSILKERASAFASGEFTDSVILTRFWIPESGLKDIEAKLEPLGFYSIEATDPSKDDNVPSLMNNTKWNLPFEALTKLYSPPKYGAVDPTPKIAPFFFIFFGMCLGDAGYAVVMAGLLFFVFRKYKKIPVGIKEFLKLFLFVSVSTFVYGAITGSFFGDLFAVVPFLRPLNAVRETFMLLDPMQNIMLVLGISLAFGVIHLFYGMILAFKELWAEENYVDALFDKAAWLVFLSGIILIAGCSTGTLPRILMGVFQGITVFGALVIMWHAGLEKKNIFSKIVAGFLAIYGATSWLGDILSYSRLLALGLASAAIAMVINMLGGLVVGIPYVGWLIAIVIVVGGHIFNLAINVLGAFVHSLRLQYVEFFNKFYSGGGREFNPLSCNAKYVNISEK
ncbi:MAG: V-type ATP synthase subunit I [Synergistaceae bacterium]|nr:V-type ATP synthase subunit I [Synergistaceae bacterium]